MTSKSSIKAQLPAMVSLAIPVVVTQLGQMLMGVVDIFMVGKLGPLAIGSVAVGTAISFIPMIIVVGLLASLDHYISSCVGAKDYEGAREWKVQGLYLALIVSVPAITIDYILANNLKLVGIPDVTAHGTRIFLQLFNLSYLPFLIFIALRQYLQSTGRSTIVTTIIFAANIFNFVGNWVFINGKFGFPAMGIQGSALSTLINRSLVAISLIFLAFWNQPKPKSWRINFKHLKNLLRLGIPSGLQLFFEVAVFSLSTVFASRLGPASLAAHSIVLNIASFTFMVPLGISFSAAIRVAYFYGAKDLRKSFDAGYAAYLLGFSFMLLSGIVLSLGGKIFVGFFTADHAVIALAQKIILLAALFQVADGVQVVSTGALRGLGKTKIAALINFIGYWIIAFPASYLFCFTFGWGLYGLWTGLTLGLFSVAIVLYRFWVMADRKDRLLSLGVVS